MILICCGAKNRGCPCGHPLSWLIRFGYFTPQQLPSQPQLSQAHAPLAQQSQPSTQQGQQPLAGCALFWEQQLGLAAASVLVFAQQVPSQPQESQLHAPLAQQSQPATQQPQQPSVEDAAVQDRPAPTPPTARRVTTRPVMILNMGKPPKVHRSTDRTQETHDDALA